MFSKRIAKNTKNIVNQAPDDPTNEEDVCKTIRVSKDFPERIIRVRYKLYPFLKSSNEEGRHSYLKYNRLMVDFKNIYMTMIMHNSLAACQEIGHKSRFRNC